LLLSSFNKTERKKSSMDSVDVEAGKRGRYDGVWYGVHEFPMER